MTGKFIKVFPGQFKHATYCRQTSSTSLQTLLGEMLLFSIAMIGRYVALVYQEVILVESLWA